MNYLNPIFSIIAFILACLTSYLIIQIGKSKVEVRQYETIDGLRGFLAIGVFIHHSSIWYNYIHTGDWVAPDSNFYNQVGQTSVCFFFMITSFLFVSKLIKSNVNFNWRNFFIARGMRLMPMYYFSLAIIILTVLILTNWKMNVGKIDFVSSIFQWIIFGIASSASINNVDFTNLINAGILWTLPFEWLFYFSMPLLGLLLLKNKPGILYIGLSIVFSAIIIYDFHPSQMHYLYAFLFGAVAPFLLKYTKAEKHAGSILISFLIIICIILIAQFRTNESMTCKILIGIVFTCVALGNSIFGILKNSAIKLLGDISYSTYLLHGIILFYVFHFGFGIEVAKALSPVKFWVIIFLITPILVFVSFLTFKYIEKPAIEFSKKRLTK
jgi:Predicted acyltransferases